MGPPGEYQRPAKFGRLTGNCDLNSHIWPMMKTAPEFLTELGHAIRARRIAQRLSQQEASTRSGVPERTWRRLEQDGEGSIRHLVQGAVALRCEHNLSLLFPEPVATSMDALLARQSAEAKPKPRQRAPRRRKLP